MGKHPLKTTARKPGFQGRVGVGSIVYVEGKDTGEVSNKTGISGKSGKGLEVVAKEYRGPEKKTVACEDEKWKHAQG